MSKHRTEYFVTDCDARGRRLVGHGRYTLTFPKDATPSQCGIWSLSTWRTEGPLEPNPAGRYSIDTKSTGIQNNPDGSLTIYLQAESPGRPREANWLPIPDGPFELVFRRSVSLAPGARSRR
jgi:hypothetical protein